MAVRQAKTIIMIHFKSKGGSTSAKVWLIVIEDYRVGKDITNDKDIVKNIEQVIQRRLDNALLSMSDILQYRSTTGLICADLYTK